MSPLLVRLTRFVGHYGFGCKAHVDLVLGRILWEPSVALFVFPIPFRFKASANEGSSCSPKDLASADGVLVCDLVQISHELVVELNDHLFAGHRGIIWFVI